MANFLFSTTSLSLSGSLGCSSDDNAPHASHDSRYILLATGRDRSLVCTVRDPLHTLGMLAHCRALGSRLADVRGLNAMSSRRFTISVDSEKGRGGVDRGTR